MNLVKDEQRKNWITEKASVVVVGNVQPAALEKKQEVFAKYKERIFDREYHLHAPEKEAMDAVLKEVLNENDVSIDIESVLGEFRATDDKNLRTLRRIGLELIDLQRSLKAVGESDLADHTEVTRTLVALIVEKYSRGKDIRELTGSSSWIDGNSPGGRLGFEKELNATKSRM